MEIRKLLNASHTYYDLHRFELKLKKFSLDLENIYDKSQALHLYENILNEHNKFTKALSPLINITQILENQKKQVKSYNLNLLGIDKQFISNENAIEKINYVDFLMNHTLICSTAKKFNLMGEHLSVIHLLKDYLDTPDIKSLYSKYKLDNSLMSTSLLLNSSLIFQKNAKEPYLDAFMSEDYDFFLIKEVSDTINKKIKQTPLNNHLNQIKDQAILLTILYHYVEGNTHKETYESIKNLFINKNIYSNLFQQHKQNFLSHEEDRKKWQEKTTFKLNQDIFFNSFGIKFKEYVNNLIIFINNEVSLNQKRKHVISEYEIKEVSSPSLLDRIKKIKDKNPTLVSSKNKEIELNHKPDLFPMPKLNIKY